MTERLDLDALEAVARAATPGPWTYKPTILGLPNTTVMAGDDQLGYMGVGHFLAPNATHVATFDPPTVLALIAKLREAEAVIAAARHAKSVLDNSRYTSKVKVASGILASAFAAYKPTNQEGETDEQA